MLDVSRQQRRINRETLLSLFFLIIRLFAREVGMTDSAFLNENAEVSQSAVGHAIVDQPKYAPPPKDAAVAQTASAELLPNEPGGPP